MFLYKINADSFLLIYSFTCK